MSITPLPAPPPASPASERPCSTHRRPRDGADPFGPLLDRLLGATPQPSRGRTAAVVRERPAAATDPASDAGVVGTAGQPAGGSVVPARSAGAAGDPRAGEGVAATGAAGDVAAVGAARLGVVAPAAAAGTGAGLTAATPGAGGGSDGAGTTAGAPGAGPAGAPAAAGPDVAVPVHGSPAATGPDAALLSLGSRTDAGTGAASATATATVDPAAGTATGTAIADPGTGATVVDLGSAAPAPGDRAPAATKATGGAAPVEIAPAAAADDAATGAAVVAAPAGVSAPVGAAVLAAADAPAPASAGAAPVLEQLAPSLARVAARGDGVHQMSLRLHPADLGEIHLTVTVRGDRVDVEIAARPEARALLHEGSTQLRGLLESVGRTAGQLVLRDLPSGGAPATPLQGGAGQPSSGHPGGHTTTTYQGDGRERHRSGPDSAAGSDATTGPGRRGQPAEATARTDRGRPGLDLTI